MIRLINSDLPNFKTLHLHPGLNVLLAVQSETATDKETRNGVGKTSLIELIHFLMGAEASPDSIFRRGDLARHRFTATADVYGAPLTWSRSGERPGFLRFEGVLNADQSRAIDSVGATIADSGEIRTRDFQAFLGSAFFGLDGEDEPAGPSFGQLFAYFVRRERRGGFTDPFKQNTWQGAGDQQLALSYLTGLDWTLAIEWERVRRREKSLDALRKALREGDVGLPTGSAAEIRSQLVVAERQAAAMRENVSTFRVIDEYGELEREANALTRELSEILDDNAADSQLITHIEDALRTEVAQEPTTERVEELYRRASVELPQLVQRRLDEVESFHRALISNRRSYLQGELDAAQRRVAERRARSDQLDLRRSQVVGVLRQAGAIGSIVEIQSELARLEARAASLREQYDIASKVESERVDLGVERADLLRRLQQNLSERSDVTDDMVVTFQEISSELYESPGTLVMEPGLNGLMWKADVSAGLSRGIGNMQVLNFDLTLAVQLARRGTGPGFLVHDSHIFDGVDERQIATGLRLGAKLAAEHGFQYIVTMNSDAVPETVDLRQYALPVTLTDRSEEGGLFGFRFD